MLFVHNYDIGREGGVAFGQEGSRNERRHLQRLDHYRNNIERKETAAIDEAVTMNQRRKWNFERFSTCNFLP